MKLMPAAREASSEQALFDKLLDAAKRDEQTVTAEGKPARRLTHGVTFREVPTHADLRGSVIELYDPRWEWHPDPLVFSYCFTIRPNIVKGWSLHKEHEDRYILLQGEMMLVLYDVRPGSPTHGEICEIVLSEHNRRLVNIPKNVWHADYNFGARDVLALNFPTTPYEHQSPDKYRLPIDTPLIPYSFGNASGW
jgi:dTDP-4-dehydrorhamnose 3,5-epimerase